MVDNPTGASGSPDLPGGNDPENKDDKKDTVAYDTYRKLLSEKKKRDEEVESIKAKLAEMQRAEKERTEAELKQKEDYKSLLALREEEIKKRDSELSELKTSLEAGAKLRSFLDSVNGVVDKQYWALIDLDAVKIDPNTNLPDQASVDAAARKFEQEYGLVLKKKDGTKGLPNQAAQSASGKMTVSEWKALKSSKEMKEKYNQVDWATQ